MAERKNESEVQENDVEENVAALAKEEEDKELER